ncbi:DUF1206 domain-containing protein [Streptomyces sp. P38-E01]|uniref:DUF1206 domain-containing protein n=1 Tax=Streptomyces tardus TaxID=2780544 RepID=A0A949JGU8_9ACTN|nr:DUF1206 domain-containing protein [Streptomyces tardus]MBU7598350.1 DUF1206 domain-containing protein [Streptomyces tardus]
MGTATSTVDEGKATARRAANSDAMTAAARAGLSARGAIYLVIGLLSVQIAFGGSSEQADRGGALAQVADQPFGMALLWALAVGLVGMALWRLSEALFGAAGPDGHKAYKRALSAGRFVLYAFIAYSAVTYALGESGSGSSDEQSKDGTASALEMPFGQWIVGAVGAGFVIGGGVVAVKAGMRKYHAEMRRSRMSPWQRKLVDLLGVPGGIAQGLVLGATGVFAIKAALDFDPDEAKGMDDTLRAFTDTPVGPWLLVAVAVGLALFGAFSFAMARWGRV